MPRFRPTFWWPSWVIHFRLRLFSGYIPTKIEHSPLGMERPQKRRRLSGEGFSDDSASSTTSEREHDATPVPRETAPTHQISRIGRKTSISPRSHGTVPTPSTPKKNAVSSTTFASLGVSTWLTHTLTSLSIRSPTPIQRSTIPAILAGRDCIGGSQTGSGKTLAFALPIIQRWSEDPSSVYAAVLTPTRELALQIHEQIIALGTKRGLRCCLVTGGGDARTQAIELERKPHIVVATPGRLADHVLNSGEETVAALRRCKFVVLDEADRLLKPGKGTMLGDLETCLSILPKPETRQTLLFTATVTPEVRALKEMPRPKSRGDVYVCEVDSDSRGLLIDVEEQNGSDLQQSISTPVQLPPGLKQTYQLVNLQHKEKYLHILLLTPLNLNKTTDHLHQPNLDRKTARLPSSLTRASRHISALQASA